MHVVNDSFFFKKKANDASIENGWLLVTCGPFKRGKDQLLVMGLNWIYILGCYWIKDTQAIYLPEDR